MRPVVYFDTDACEFMSREKRQRSFGTHSGTFHADEVTACALLLLHDLIDQDKILRTRDSDQLAMCEFVCDVGGVYDPSQRLFDHHQAEYEGELSSAGMVLLYLKETSQISVKEYTFINETLIQGVDAHDNGREKPIKGHCSFSNVITNFVPIEHSATREEQDRAFLTALDFVCGHLKRLWERYHYHSRCLKLVAECMTKYKDSECLIFEKSMSWLESFFELDGVNHGARFVIMPSGEHWKLRAIPPSYEDRMSVRQPLPREWAGLLDSDLKDASGIEGAVFCHKGRFISVWETKDDALKALEITLSKEFS